MARSDAAPKPSLRLTRREALAALAAAGGYALAASPIQAQAIKTDGRGLVAGMVTVAGADGTPIPVYEAYPEREGEFPVVVVVHEAFGLHEHIKDVVRRFAKEGYYAVAPELFSREGGVAHLTDIEKIRPIVANAPLRRVVGDLRAAAEYARKQPAARGDRVGVTGFCMGGQMALMLSASYRDTTAVVAWYGSLTRAVKDDPKPLTVLDVADRISAAALLLYGGQDQGIPIGDVDRLEALLKARGVPVEKRIYADAGHAFHADYRPTYRADAARDAWGRCLAWFQKYLKV